MKERVQIEVFGLVQGVFFRAFILEKAKELGISGWVSNEPGEGIKIVAEGEEKDLIKLIEYCHKGPRFAKVDKVVVKWEKLTEGFSEFIIKYD